MELTPNIDGKVYITSAIKRGTMANPTAPTNVPEYLKRYKVYLLVAKFVRILFYVCVASCFA